MFTILYFKAFTVLKTLYKSTYKYRIVSIYFIFKLYSKFFLNSIVYHCFKMYNNNGILVCLFYQGERSVS